MAYVCFNCDKGTFIGSQHRHHPGVAGRQHMHKVVHTPKKFKPNLHSAKIVLNGIAKKVLLCTKCRRLLKEQGIIKTWTKEIPKVETVEKVKKIITSKVVKPLEIAPKKEIAKPPKKEAAKKESKETVSVEELVGKK